jgi:uncharacterized protein (TIGR03435 family)
VKAWSRTAVVIGVVALLVGGTTTVAVKEIESHRAAQAWRAGFDMSALDRMPRQATIVPALSSRAASIQGWRVYHGMFLGLNQSMTNIVSLAYGISLARTIFSSPAPPGKYDFISNTPKNQLEALQQEIKKKFNLVGQREWIVTNALVLTLRNRNAGGWKRSVSANPAFAQSNGFISVSNYPAAALKRLAENLLESPIADRAGLTGSFDLRWDSTSDGLKNAIFDQLGIELVPGSERVEFLVVNQAN